MDHASPGSFRSVRLKCRSNKTRLEGKGSALLRRRSRCRQRIVIEDRREPSLRLGDGPALAARIVLDLVALNLADAEIMAVGMAEIEPADGRAGPHGKALGQLDADAALGLEQVEHRRLLAVVGLGRIAGRRADSAI